MDINKGKLVYIKNKSSYNSNVFLDTLVIFVEDTKEIITHGISFAGIPSSYNMYVGAKDKKANASTTNGNTYIKLYKDSTLSNQFNIKGTGATKVVSDASGNITINSTDNNTWRALQVKGTQIASTGTSTYPINFAEGTDITLTGTAGTSTTKLNSITINHASINTTVTAAKDTATLLAYSGEITVPTAITTNNGHITAYTWTKYKLPAASHYTTHIYAGASGATANSTSDVSNPYLTVVDNTTYRNQVQFKGGGKTTIKAKNGVITISSTDTWNAFVGATSSKAGTAGYVPAPSSGQTGLYFRSDGTWATPPGTYSLPTASNTTLGGVKTGAAITNISGYTAVHIKDGVIYYKNTTYSTKALKINGNTYNVYTSNASLPTIYAPTAVGTAGQVLATNSNADGLEWKSVATTTKSMKVNGANYSIYTTGASLPTIYAPTALGTAGQVLKMNSDGTALIWATDATIANTWRPVQALKSDGTSLGTLNNNSTTLSLKAGSNITLAYSSGTITITGVGNTWTALKGATASANGTAGYAPKPTKGQQGYYLKGNATWVKPSLSEFTDDVVSGNYVPINNGTAAYATLLAKQGGTSTSTSSWNPNPVKNYVKVWGLNFFDTNITADSGDIALFLRKSEYVTNGSELCMIIDGDYYAGADSNGPYKVWHAGNFNPSNYITTSGGIITSNDVGLTIRRTTTYPIISYYGGNTSTQSFYGSLGFSGSNTPCYVDNTGKNVYTLLHSNNIGSYNSGSATKLATPRTIWGQSFNGENNVDGKLTLTDASNQVMLLISSGNNECSINYRGKDGYTWVAGKGCDGLGDQFAIWSYTAGKNILTCTSSGNVGIGTNNPTNTLHVHGSIQLPLTISTTFKHPSTNLGVVGLALKSATSTSVTGYDGLFGWSEGGGLYMFNAYNYSNVLCAIGITNDGIPYIGKGGDLSTKHTIWHAGNFNPTTHNAASASLIKSSLGTYGASNWNPQPSFTSIWAEKFEYSNLGADTGDLVFYLRKSQYVDSNGVELCLAIDGDYYAGTGNYKVWHAGNHRSNGEIVWNIEGADFNPGTKDGTYIGMSTLTGIEGNWRHVVSMNWSQTGDTVGNATWCSLLSLPTLNRKGIYYRSGTSSTSFGTWVKLIDENNIGSYVGSGSGNANGKFNTSLEIFSTGSSYNEGVRIHTASNNWCGVVLCGSDNTSDSGTSAKSWGIHNNEGSFYINKGDSNGTTNNILCNVNDCWGIATNSPSYRLHVNGSFNCTSFYINGSQLTFVT